MKIVDNKLVPFIELDADPYNLERQQLPKSYASNGSIYVTLAKSLFEKNNVIIKENCGAYFMDETYSLDVDTNIDLLLIDIVMKKLIKGENL